MWEPAGHRLLVRPDDPPDKIGSFFVPEWVKDNRATMTVEGVIVAVGMTAWKAFDAGEPWAKVGDRVMFAKYGGQYIEDKETKEKLRLLNDEDITAIWREESNNSVITESAGILVEPEKEKESWQEKPKKSPEKKNPEPKKMEKAPVAKKSITKPLPALKVGGQKKS